ncbi:hypothetical protein BDZ85DRAFT_252231 [Elsinoe ampelina]|uniref:Uncharacterized protein n=1 Tax=Elsinoe ampelina TaxID=302913 RepID=A0A6A6G3M0_9PEZI|nr:hypothetical protein BDZ85DRAFT_252231 [Elsinoe ampelina]
MPPDELALPDHLLSPSGVLDTIRQLHRSEGQHEAVPLRPEKRPDMGIPGNLSFEGQLELPAAVLVLHPVDDVDRVIAPAVVVDEDGEPEILHHLEVNTWHEMIPSHSVAVAEGLHGDVERHTAVEILLAHLLSNRLAGPGETAQMLIGPTLTEVVLVAIAVVNVGVDDAFHDMLVGICSQVIVDHEPQFDRQVEEAEPER